MWCFCVVIDLVQQVAQENQELMAKALEQVHALCMHV